MPKQKNNYNIDREELMATFFFVVSFLCFLLSLVVALFSIMHAIYILIVSLLFAVYSGSSELAALIKSK